MTKRKIHAHLKEGEEIKNPRGVLFNSMKEKDIERLEVKAVLKNSETENMLHPINVDQTFGPRKEEEKSTKSVNKLDYVDGANVVNYPARGEKNA